ncbi:MAG: ribonuclease HII [Nanoarchaeota archaeon]|nr:ribonuclease HII [Nanoarchaeota archaeon]
MLYLGGVDEAGRGPVLGPMVMSIVAITDKQRQLLNKSGVKDSKVLTPLKRTKLARVIKDQCAQVTIKVSPQEIDKALRDEESSLNELEAKTTAKLISRISKQVDCKEVMLDLPSRNKEQYLSSIQKYLPHALRDITLYAEFKADANHVEVAAASIIAKVARDASIRSYEKRLNLHLGSGYPSDPYTVAALEKHFDILKKEKLIRLEWKTVKALLEKRSQSTLGNF